MLDLDDLLSLSEFGKLKPGDQTRVRAFFFRKFVAPRPYYKTSSPEERQEIARETIFGPEEPRAKPTLPERFLARAHEALSLGVQPAEGLPPPETTGEALTEQAGSFIGGAPPFFVATQAGFPAGAALASKLGGAASRFAAPTLARNVGEEALKFGLTGTLLGAAGGAAQGKSPLETAKAIAQRFPEEAAFGGAFGALRPRVPPFALEPPPSVKFGEEARKSFAEEEAAQPKPPPGGPAPSQPGPAPTGGLPPSLSIPAFTKSPSGKDMRIDFENPVEKAAYLYQQIGKPDLAPYIVENVQGSPEQFVKSVQTKVDQAAASADRLGLSFGYVKAGEAAAPSGIPVGEINRRATAQPQPTPRPTRRQPIQQPPVLDELMTKEGAREKRRAEAALRLEDAEIKKQQIIKDARMILADPNVSQFSREAAFQALKDVGLKPGEGPSLAEMMKGSPGIKKTRITEPPKMEPQLSPDVIQALQTPGTKEIKIGPEPPVFTPAKPRKSKGEPDVPSLIRDIRSRGGIWVSEEDWSDWATLRRQYPGLIGKLENAKAKGRVVEPADALADDLAAQGIIPEGGANGLQDALMGQRTAPKLSVGKQQRAELYSVATTAEDTGLLERMAKDAKLADDIRTAAEQRLKQVVETQILEEIPKLNRSDLVALDQGIKANEGLYPESIRKAVSARLAEVGEPIDVTKPPTLERFEIPEERRVSGVEVKAPITPEEQATVEELTGRPFVEREPPRFELTQAGVQGILAETPQRAVPTTGLKAKARQAEGLTKLEKVGIPDNQVDLFGPKVQGGDRFTPNKNPQLDAELAKRFPRGGAPVAEDALLTNIRSDDIRMLPREIQRALLADKPVPVNYAEPGKLAQVKFEFMRWASIHDVPISMPLEFIYRGSAAGEHLLSEMNDHFSKVNAIHHYFLDTVSKALEIVPDTARRQIVGRLLDTKGARYVAEQMNILNPTGRPIPAPDIRTVARITQQFRELSPEQVQLYSQLRYWLDEAGRTVGFEPGLSFTDYLSRFRESIEIGRTIQIRIGEGEVAKTLQEIIPQKLKAYFEKPRTTDQPADLPLEETLKIYSAALARRIATSGGLDPRAPSVPIEGFLNRINPALAQIPQPLQPFTRVLLEYYLGLGKGASERSVGTELIRLVQFNRNMGLNLFSPVINHTQKMNTMAEVGPTAFVQGFRDMYDPQRMAIARQAGADIDLGPIMQELTQLRAEGRLGQALEKLQDATKVTGYLFRLSEKSNQVHAFLSGLRRAEQVFGEINPEAISYARDIQAATQFGMPSSKVLTWEQNGIAGAWGQFKRFQVNQLLYPARILSKDIFDWKRGNYMSGTRTLGYLTAITALIGADGIFPGLDDQIRKRIFEKWPGGLAGLMGVYLADRAGLGVENSLDIMRSVLFFLPGPMANNLIDAWSGARGIDFWTGREMGSAERASKLTRSIPLSGIVLDRVRRAWVESQGPLQPNTIGEGFGIYPPTGARGEPRTAREIAMMGVGLPAVSVHEELERKRGRADVRLDAMRTLREASDKFISGEIASSRGEANRAVELKSDAMKLIEDFNTEHPGARLRLQGRNLREARERRRFTPTERQKRAYPRALRGIEEMQEPPVFEPAQIQ